MLQQLCDDTSNSVLIENNGVAPDWDCNLFLSNFIEENRIPSIIAELSLTLGVNGPYRFSPAASAVVCVAPAAAPPRRPTPCPDCRHGYAAGSRR